MHVSALALLRSLTNELSDHFAGELSEASIGQSAISAVRLLQVREKGGEALATRRLDAATEVIDRLAAIASLAANPQFMELQAQAREARQVRAADPADTLARLTAQLETVLAQSTATSIDGNDKTELTRLLAQWEVADRRSLTQADDASDDERDERITQDRFEAYLRDRFGEPDLQVASFRPLPGGFGKQTILVSVEGRAVDGALVIRRDPRVPLPDNDCHRVRNEYPVIRAAFGHGFPAPDALWLDTEHRLLPGPDFFVMRMSLGKTGGNVFKSTQALSGELVDVLASGVARLHGLPPLTELGDLTDSIRVDRWSMSIHEATRLYVQGWLDLFRANAHNPSPTLMALYGWVLDNIPDAPGHPVLVHGDVGFHNMLIDEGRLSALVDWEFAHIGDPAEDMGSIRNALGDALWGDVMRAYRAAGGPDIDAQRLHFFRVWQHVRNASASNLAMGKFQTGEVTDLKLAYTGHYHFPLFIKAASDLIAAGPEGAELQVDY